LQILHGIELVKIGKEMEEWKIGRMEEWKNGTGRLEEWEDTMGQTIIKRYFYGIKFHNQLYLT